MLWIFLYGEYSVEIPVQFLVHILERVVLGVETEQSAAVGCCLNAVFGVLAYIYGVIYCIVVVFRVEVFLLQRSRLVEVAFQS